MSLVLFVLLVSDSRLRSASAAVAAAAPAGAAAGAAAAAAAEQHVDRIIQETLLLAYALEAAGAAALTLHGRTKDEKGRDTGAADWGVIRRVKQRLQIPGLSERDRETDRYLLLLLLLLLLLFLLLLLLLLLLSCCFLSCCCWSLGAAVSWCCWSLAVAIFCCCCCLLLSIQSWWLVRAAAATAAVAAVSVFNVRGHVVFGVSLSDC